MYILKMIFGEITADKPPVLPPCVVDGRTRSPFYYYYYYSVISLDHEGKDVVGCSAVEHELQPGSH